MMEIIATILASIGGLALALGIAALAINLYFLFERVSTLEVNDNDRKNDIIEIRKQIARMTENNK